MEELTSTGTATMVLSRVVVPSIFQVNNTNRRLKLTLCTSGLNTTVVWL